MLRTLSLAALLLVQAVALTATQATTGPAVVTPADKNLPRLMNPLPFRPGETLIYDVKFSRLVFGGTIGELKIAITKPRQQPVYELTAEAVSKGFFPRLFGVKVQDEFSARVSAEDLGLDLATRVIRQGSVQREQTSVVNRESGTVTYTDRDLTREDEPPKVKEAESPTWIQDVLSAIYYVRALKLSKGDRVEIPITDEAKIYKIEIVVGERDETKVAAGRFNTVEIDAKIFDGRYIRRSGEMIVWMSDDELRIPVRARIKTSGTTVNIELQRVQYQTPIISPR